MKRSELKRSGELKRTGFIRRVAATVARWIAKPAKRIRRKPRRNANPAVLAEYAETHEACACCGTNVWAWGSWLETHHIFGGAMRVDIAANLIRLCKVCHDRATANKLTRAHCLWLKQELGEFDPQALRAMLKRFGNRRLPEPVEPPRELRRA